MFAAVITVCGRAVCLPNKVTQEPLVEVILRKIQEEFLKPANPRRLRQEVTRQVKKMDPAKLREVLNQAVSRVECWFEHRPYGQKGKVQSFLTHGRIHMRPELVVKPGTIAGSMTNAHYP